MAATHVNPTRMELTRLKRKLVTALRGHKLLKDKRDELMRQYLDLVRLNRSLREKVEQGIRSANQNFMLARAGMPDEGSQRRFDGPEAGGIAGSIKTQYYERGSSGVSVSHRTSDPNDIYSYGFAFTSGDLDDAVKSLADLLPDMLKLAEVEKSCRMMAAEIERPAARQCLGAYYDSRTTGKYQIYHDETG